MIWDPTEPSAPNVYIKVVAVDVDINGQPAQVEKPVDDDDGPAINRSSLSFSTLGFTPM